MEYIIIIIFVIVLVLIVMWTIRSTPKCPMCGQFMSYSDNGETMVCDRCGYKTIVEDK
jgi:ribosomal protein S27AE